MGKSVDEVYKTLSDIDHILLRPEMYAGSTITENIEKWILGDYGKFILKKIEYNGFFLKLFDEIISNSIDESKRPGTRLNTIKVEVDQENGTIMVHDNGGIPVEIHKQSKMYVPQLIFGNLRSSSNYDDNDDRTWVGTNGLGAKVSNIFSTRFEVTTADGKNKFHMVWTNNMKKHTQVEVSRSNSHFTKIIYTPDLKRFSMDRITDDMLKSIKKRVYELAGCNPELNICFQGRRIMINSFQDYCNMYLDDNNSLIYEENKDWKIGIAVSRSGNFQQISYVNSVYTYDGGTHIDYVLNQIIPFLREKISRKYKTDILPGQIKNHLFLFVDATIINPSFGSQTKEKMISDVKNFKTEIRLSEKFLNNIYKSEITNSITDWLDQKKSADEKKAERDANKALSKVRVEKLIDCKWAGTSKKDFTSLSITEGDSASTGFRKFRDARTQSLFPIRGKILNVRDASKEKIRANEEIKGIMSAMGLKFGQSPFEYENGKLVKDNLRIHEVRIYSDQDTDGYQISALLLNIFAFFWPELIKEHRIARVDTPIVIARQGKKTIKMYNLNEYDDWCKNNDVLKWNIEYNTGLGSLQDKDYKEIIENPNIYYYELDDTSFEELDIWMGKDADKRKQKLFELLG